MTQALVVMRWAVGAALVLLAAVTLSDWTRRGGRSRQYLSLTVGLLGVVAVLSQVETVTSVGRPVIDSVLVVAFMGSALALVLFRQSLIPGRRWVTWLLAVLAVLVSALTIAVTVTVPPPSSSLAVEGVALWVDLSLVLTWCLLVGLSIAQVWRASRDLPNVQRARLRALCGGFTGIIAALVADAAAAGVTQDIRYQVVIECIVLASLPLLTVAFSPPAWVRRVWREREEVQFRGAVNDLLLYSPDIETLCVRAIEWPSRLLGGRGAMIALNGTIVAAEGMERSAAERLHAEVEPICASGKRSAVGSMGPVALAPLVSQAGNGYVAVLGGPFTPLMGTEELLRLDQYRVSITVALDRVHLVEKLRRNAELLDLAYDAVFTWDLASGGIQYWNRGAAQLYGHQPEEALGRRPKELLETQYPQQLETILAALAEDDHWEGELAQRTKDGRRLQISARWALQRDAGGLPATVLEINRDISSEKVAATELRRARDAAEQASSAKSEYLSRMSHELRTPLAAMLGFSDLLELREPREDQAQAIDAIQRAGSHLLSLVNDVLDIARIESGREMLSLAPLEVAPLLEQCAGLVSHAAAERHVDLAVEVDDADRLHVRGDRQRLVQVVLNLLTNAIKYGRDGGHVALRAAMVDGEVEVQVLDDGPGLSDDGQARLFQPFERLGAERSHVQGTGLGLALCRQLTSAMGGTIGVRSSPGEGACFWVRLKPARANEAASEVPAAGPAMLHDARAEKTVLYVEDNLSTIALVESIFALRPNIRLITAMQGSLAVELASEHRPDLVILDVHLPDLNGDEVMHRLRADPRTAEIPVVMYSADATEKQVQRLLSEGAVAYLTKPARVTEFLAMLDRTLARPVPARA